MIKLGSMATRESEGTIYTHAGPEIGVASTKAFTSQLVALNLLALFLGQMKGSLGEADARSHLTALMQLPKQMEQALKASGAIEDIAGRFFNRRRLPTGTEVDVAATNNLLLDLIQLHELGLRRRAGRRSRGRRRPGRGRSAGSSGRYVPRGRRRPRSCRGRARPTL